MRFCWRGGRWLRGYGLISLEGINPSKVPLQVHTWIGGHLLVVLGLISSKLGYTARVFGGKYSQLMMNFKSDNCDDLVVVIL